ncbi:iron-siderophore ABC transporter substrate-binding protein [Motilibacter aurantiacus]|uniref:iron-siderophore ABC transporter substrate-binding protein n=1 Tax=Motilibacter aurantiacus TaxID=2714955 RepID=UPI00140988BB|nr:iron-siderophore ABC transporter substrate-binding protein [Motilibacter aurantiacus]NHC45477.1 iron-siderophore ABC transporter substrate-binding protein [Motilibacter aurantiacus]
MPYALPLARLRRRAAVVLSVVAVGLVSACGGSDDGGATGSGGGAEAQPSGSAAAGAFPVSIPHALGTTTIEEQPERVVTLGWGSQDVALALGVVPVGMPKFTYGGNAQGILPWNEDKLAGQAPTLLDESDGVPFEAVAALQPDVILATYSGIQQADYDRLAQIAPTVAYPETPWLTSWQEQTTLVGAALGKSTEAQQLVAETEQAIAKAGTDNPVLAGKSFTYGNAAGPGAISAYVTGDPRVTLLTGMGMEPAPGIETLKPGSGQFYADVSIEQADTLDSDVLVMWYGSEDVQKQVEAQKLFQELPAVQRGSYVALTDQSFVFATSAVSVLSIPWSLDTFVPQLVEAAEKA